MSVLKERQLEGCILGGQTSGPIRAAANKAAFAAVADELLGKGKASDEEVALVNAILEGLENGRAVWADRLKLVAAGGGSAEQNESVMA